jgi:hypothetical protein
MKMIIAETVNPINTYSILRQKTEFPTPGFLYDRICVLPQLYATTRYSVADISSTPLW